MAPLGQQGGVDAGSSALRLLPGVELLGEVQGSARIEPPHLIRRPDGQVVQLSRLFYALARHARPGCETAEIAAELARELDVRVTPNQVEYVLEHKLHPLGIVAAADGSSPVLKRLHPLFGLRARIGVIPPRLVNAIADVLRPLFLLPVVVVVLGALLSVDGWLLLGHGVGAGVSHLIQQPTIALLLFALTAISLAFHELGHAAACRYSGGRLARSASGSTWYGPPSTPT